MLDRLGREAAAAHAGLQHKETAQYGLGVGGNLSINPVYGWKLGCRPFFFFYNDNQSMLCLKKRVIALRDSMGATLDCVLIREPHSSSILQPY